MCWRACGAATSMPPEPKGLSVTLSQAGPIPIDVSMECSPGELLAIVGSSGAGKTTVLRTIAGLYAPAAGRIACNGETWFDAAAGIMLPPQARAAGLVFQDYALFPHLSALDNVRLAMHHVPEPERTAAARSLLERVHLGGLEARKPDQLSGGQRQRVALGRALARDPKVLLLDEPFSAVDRMTREPLKEEIASLHRALAIPIVLVTHDLEEALALADRICVIDRGRTLQTGTPEDVRLRPVSAVVARLMGQTNIFTGEVERRSGVGVPGRIRWQGRSLHVAETGPFKTSDRVAWLVASDYIDVVEGEGQNQSNIISGVLADATELGERTVLRLRFDEEEAELRFSLASRDARARGLAAGRTLTVRLLPEGIHLVSAKG
jgi:molybdate transport system ATP-binding protein